MSLWDDSDPERQIYTDLSSRPWDPLQLRRLLVAASKGALWKAVADRRKALAAMHAAKDDPERLGAAELALGKPEQHLALWGREVFAVGRPLSEAEALRHLDHFLEWCEAKKGRSG